MFGVSGGANYVFDDLSFFVVVTEVGGGCYGVRWGVVGSVELGGCFWVLRTEVVRCDGVGGRRLRSLGDRLGGRCSSIGSRGLGLGVTENGPSPRRLRLSVSVLGSSLSTSS